jgi:hypothetical protein
MTRRLLLALLAAALAILAYRELRGYPWPLALLIGSAIGALVYAAQRTVDQLREASRTHSRWDR